MSNWPAFLENDVKECEEHVDEEGCPRVYRWIGDKPCPECAGTKTGNVHYEHYTVNLREYKNRYGKDAEPAL